MKIANIYPILLAAGPSPRLGTKKSPAKFSGRNAIQIAVDNCAGLARPVVVLGHGAKELHRRVPNGAEIVINRQWRDGLLSSLLAGLERVPRGAAFMMYPVDHVYLMPRVICALARAFEKRKKSEKIFMPRFRGLAGHPVIFSADLRRELRRAKTARDIVYRKPGRICYVAVRTPAIWKNFSAC